MSIGKGLSGIRHAPFLVGLIVIILASSLLLNVIAMRMAIGSQRPKVDQREQGLQGATHTPDRSVDSIHPSPLVSGIDSLGSIGVPGPLFALNAKPVPIVAGDNDTSPVTSVVVMASGLGNGRVLAFSAGFFTNEALEFFDNKLFGNNVMDWLDKLGKHKILVTRAHGEWSGGSNFDDFKAELETQGYNVTRFHGAITSSVLSDVGIVLIGTAWGNVSSSEIDALTDFVSNGGGLFLEGLGWSWKAYRGPLDEFPMNKIAEPYGIRWIDGYITDESDNYEGQPIFHTFYPNIEIQTTYQAFSYIETTTITHPSDLPSLLQTNLTIRRKYTNAHLLIATATRELSLSSPQRQEIYDFYKNLINVYPQYFKKEVVYDRSNESTMAWIRERVYRSFTDALPLTENLKSEIASTFDLFGRYLDIWTDFTVLLLDNTQLNEKQKDFIYTYLNLLPKGIHDLRSISVADYLGQTSPEVPLWSTNIFGVNIGDVSENTFPDDVLSGEIDVFCSVVVHEINHAVDAFYIRGNEVLRDRKDKLIADAGSEHLNYLRSMFHDGFFASAPQEFFASISQQWFTDSNKTIELGLVRFDKGYRHPINQALFFADVYSVGKGITYFYTVDTQGNIARQLIHLSRDGNGRIKSLTIGSWIYVFTLDANGDVIAYSRERAPLVPATVDIDPDKLNLKSGGRWITVYIELPQDYNVSDIDGNTILLEGSVLAKWIDLQDNTLMVKFDRAEIMGLLSVGETTLTITGEVNSTPFEGTDTIRVINK